MRCLCVDQGANPSGFEELGKLLDKGLVEALLILPWGKQVDETPFLYVDGELVPEPEARERALTLVKNLIERLQPKSTEPVVAVKCRYYDCIESRLGEECNEFGRSTNRDYWYVVVERRYGGHRLPALHIQFHGMSPDYDFTEVLETMIARQLEMQIREVKPE